jgi:glycosyltransferase involved in cell wall biosynthesis
MSEVTKPQQHVRSLLISTTYPADDEDWRGRFIANLVNYLGEIENLRLSVWAPPGLMPDNVNSHASVGESRWLMGLMQQGGIAHLLRTSRLRAAWSACHLLLRLRRAYQRPPRMDVYHVNWFQNILPLYGTNSPVVIGVLGSDYKLLSVKGLPSLLRVVLKQRKSIIAPNAGWMAPRLEKLFGDISEVRPIAFGVDQRWYRINRQPSTDGEENWLAVFRVTRKKLGPLLQWGKEVFNDRRTLHLIGPMQEDIHIPEWITYHGPASADELCDNWFPKASGLITLSQHDEGRPQVILEAMASGLPVVVSDIPAHIDIVKHKDSGWVVRSEADLIEAMNSLADIERNIGMGKQAHQWVKTSIGTWQDCADRYVQAYCDLLEAAK